MAVNAGFARKLKIDPVGKSGRVCFLVSRVGNAAQTGTLSR